MKRDPDAPNRPSGLELNERKVLRSSRSEPEDRQGISKENVQHPAGEFKGHKIEPETQDADLRQSRVELEESSSKYLELYNFAPVAYFTLDRKRVIREANFAAAALLGVDKRDLIGKPFSRFVSKSDRRAFTSYQEQALAYLRQDPASHDSTSCEIELIRRNGAPLYAKLDASIAVDGRLQMLVSDITDRRIAEEALRLSEGNLRAVFESVQDLIFLTDTSLKLTRVNPAVEKLLGKPANDLIGLSIVPLLDPDLTDYLQNVRRRVLEGESVEVEQVVWFNEVPITLQSFWVPMHGPEGRITGLCGVARDVTDRTKREFAPQLADEYLSPAMRSTLSKARMAAAGDSIILLVGESGSGKDYLATYIHDHSRRASGPFLSVNCATIVSESSESELFGHEGGAFGPGPTRKRGLLELAEGGTVLVNEIGELPPSVQAILLTFLDTRQFTRVGGNKRISANVRLIAATNKDLKSEVEAGRFSRDLFYRLEVMTIEVPPLRNRLEDIPVLVREILASLRVHLQLSRLPMIDAPIIERLQRYHWPGNVRELRNLLERGLILSDDQKINLSALPEHANSADWSFFTDFPTNRSLNRIIDDLKRSLVVEALRRSRGRRQVAARLLKISRDSLKYHMKTLGIKDE